ncbi:MAG: hypothetical protein QM757_10105 [Paludibaculum sp.]
MKANFTVRCKELAQIGELIAGGAVGTCEIDADLAIANIDMLAEETRNPVTPA